MVGHSKKEKRDRRALRIRAKISGTAERPRLSVFKSNTQVTAQLIDDEARVTILAISTSQSKKKTLSERVEEVGGMLAEAAKKKGVTTVVFDRGGFLYTGNIKRFADSARAGGLVF